jgi:hypothetical protein
VPFPAGSTRRYWCFGRSKAVEAPENGLFFFTACHQRPFRCDCGLPLASLAPRRWHKHYLAATGSARAAGRPAQAAADPGASRATPARRPAPLQAPWAASCPCLKRTMTCRTSMSWSSEQAGLPRPAAAARARITASPPLPAPPASRAAPHLMPSSAALAAALQPRRALIANRWPPPQDGRGGRGGRGVARHVQGHGRARGNQAGAPRRAGGGGGG